MRALACSRLSGHTSSTPSPHSWKDEPLFTPQQLFGDFGSPTDVLGHASFLERARRERERDRDEQARLSLGGYVVARLVDRVVTRTDDDEAAEAFVWHLDAVRRHLRELPAGLPETAHLLGIAEAVPAKSGPIAGLRLGLTAYAYFLEHEGRLEEALDILALAARSYGPTMRATDFAACALFSARLNRLQARWEAARHCYQAAETAAVEAGDPVSALRGRLGRAAVLRSQGNLPAARLMVEAVLEESERLGLDEVRAIAFADLGSVYALQGNKVEALHANYRAFEIAPDRLQRMRALGDVGVGLAEIGCNAAARLAFEIVITSDTSFLVRNNALIELMDLESTVGNRVAFERRRAEADTTAGRMSPSMLVDYHYKAGIGLARFGQLGRARDLLTTALRLAEANGLNAWYFQVERVLADLACCADPEPTAAVDVSRAPAVREVEEGLQRYAVLAEA